MRAIRSFPALLALGCAALAVDALIACGGRAGGARQEAPAPAPEARSERFDVLVRDDFFAGLLHGDEAALDRAMALCDRTIAADPGNGEALVWHGAGLVARSRTSFQRGDRATGMGLWNRGMAEMDRAVELEPDKVGTRIPRGAVLLATSPFVPEPARTRLLDKALGDYEKVLAIQRARFDRLPRHARTMLIYGLADGWARRGDPQRARAYYERLAREGAGTAYGERARAYLAGATTPGPTACGGCHASSDGAPPAAASPAPPLAISSPPVAGAPDLDEGWSLGYTLHRFQDDFGIGGAVASPLFGRGRMRLTLGGGVAWYPFATDAGGEEDWAAYGDLRLVLEAGVRAPGSRVRLYGFGGPVLYLLPDQLSEHRAAAGGLGGFGFEHYFAGRGGGDGPVSYFLELGGVGNGIRADRQVGRPRVGNGFLVTVGFRWYL